MSKKIFTDGDLAEACQKFLTNPIAELAAEIWKILQFLQKDTGALLYVPTINTLEERIQVSKAVLECKNCSHASKTATA